MVNTNENTPSQNDSTPKADAPKRRSRLFGGRKAAEAPVAPAPVAESVPVAESAPVDAAPSRRRTPAKSAVDHVNASEVGVADAAAAPSEPSAKAPARRRTPAKSAQSAIVDTSAMDLAGTSESPAGETPAASTGRRTPPRPTTSLLFQAPDLPPVAERAERAERASTARNGDNGSRGDQPLDDESPAVRRRSRRRPGEEPREGDDAPGTVVRVRQPREQRPAAVITEPQRVKGSTRLEAKKQRRRDGRDAGRRRPVITEAEFLARRESVDRNMVVRSKNNRIQIAVLEDSVLVEHYVAKASEASLIGNVYLGRVQNVLPSMEAAFVDIGRGRNAVLYSGEVDWEAAAADSDSKNQPRRIELALKPGDRVLVQVTKDPVGHKGARLTSQVSLPGRYLVYVPNGSMNGISRKLPDTERARLKKILKEVLPENVGVIVRTAAEGATEEQLTLDVQRLTSQWAEISRLVETSQAPVLLHSEPDLLVKIVRDVFNEDFQKLVISGDDAQQTIEAYLRSVAPDLLDRVETYQGTADAFDEYRISEQIEKALDRKVWLPSGGSLVIDRTEAMTVVDVNTGKFVGSGGNLEETVTKNNLEAAEEIVRQLRLRDIGGIIVVDFIDMVLESNRDLVLRRLVECLSRDRTKHQVAEVTSLGLVQMTRKKLGLGLIESFSEPCEHCLGRGIIIHHDPVTKHRQTPQTQPEGTGGGRRGRGSKGPSNNQPAASAPRNGTNGATHAITEDVRHALAQIAASTVHTDTATIPVQDAAASAPAAPVEQPTTAQPTTAQPESAPSQAEEAPVAASEAPVAILDIPVTKSQRSQRRISSRDAEVILDSVLDALPEPKQPGQGRSRVSRRASSSGQGIVTSGPTE
ncbi:MAG: Rne/Rng family ribonuclease [Glaciihabitans sp.]|nr:Rne/Rng family ribonuclease [Glaciihabitans sp.]